MIQLDEDQIEKNIELDRIDLKQPKKEKIKGEVKKEELGFRFFF